MDNDEFLCFLKSILTKIENVINMLTQDIPKHIPAYHKMLGIQQKVSDLGDKERTLLFLQIIGIRSVLNYLLNGRYEEAKTRVFNLKKEFIDLYILLKKK